MGKTDTKLLPCHTWARETGFVAVWQSAHGRQCPERTAMCQSLWGLILSGRCPEPCSLSTSTQRSPCT